MNDINNQLLGIGVLNSPLNWVPIRTDHPKLLITHPGCFLNLFNNKFGLQVTRDQLYQAISESLQLQSQKITEYASKNPPANGWIPSRAPATWLRSIQRTLGRAWHHLDASESVQGMLGRRDHPEDGVQPGVHRTLDWECPMDNKKTINRTLLRVSD
ncbi:hypothetical protein PGTUg99_029489 [Puccinia graminis f. sp. tritici]|uniref:Uncharacterized protein n=1 Tax=Puccinia graminis f. sp. tritici TaxID=56615 RepID=A0A5B0SM16_PUCGR|nr:hypothetical protein PGTUg99_029489 [Puccinia graminis f. sp. tritici]